MVSLSILCGLIWISKDPEERQRKLNIALVSLGGALLGGRLIYVLLNSGYFQQFPGEILMIWKGGISGLGSLIGGFLAATGYAWTTKENWQELIENILPLLVLVNSGSWIGFWLNWLAYQQAGGSFNIGRYYESNLAALMIGALVPAAVFGVLLWYRRKYGKPQFLTLPWLISLGVVLVLVSYLKESYSPVLAGFRVDAWGAFLLSGCSSILWIYTSRAGRKTASPKDSDSIDED